YWETRGYFHEGRIWARQALDRPETQERTAIRANALNGAGLMALRQGDLKEAEALYRETQAIRREIGDRNGVAAASNNLGQVFLALGDYQTARRHFEETLAFQSGGANPRGEAVTRNNLGAAMVNLGDFDAASDCFQAALALNHALGNAAEKS